MNYYTYIYYYENGTPYYVGKGVGNRAYDLHHIPVPKLQLIQRFDFLTEIEALDTEVQLIEHFGRQIDGGTLCNQTLGGLGTPGYVTPLDVVQRRAAACKEHFKHNKHPRARPYRIIKPDGTTVDIVGIRKYCRENNLSHEAMCAVAKGKHSHHKGHKCIKL